MSDEQKGFWHSLPGVLTGVAAVLTAATGLYLAVSGKGTAVPSDPVKPMPSHGAASAAPGPQPAASATPRASAKTVAMADDRFVMPARINDPDGFTNVRDARSATGRVVARVLNGETFSTYPQDGPWWEVRTVDGQVGFMHASRIQAVAKAR